MTQRERVLASSLVGILVLGGGALLTHIAFIGPYRQLNGEIAALDEEIQKKDDELKADQATIDRALKLSPRLARVEAAQPAGKQRRPAGGGRATTSRRCRSTTSTIFMNCCGETASRPAPSP